MIVGEAKPTRVVMGRPETGEPVVEKLVEIARFVEFAVDVFDDGDLERRPDPVTGLDLWRPPRRR